MSYLYSDAGYELSGYLLIKNIQIENANAISGPLSYGFPALSSFLGFVHALSRQLKEHEELSKLRLDGCLVACRDLQLHAYRTRSIRPYRFNQKRIPLSRDGKTASIIEEGRCHLTVHLAIGVYGFRECMRHAFEAFIQERVMQHRIAGGSVVSLDAKSAVTYIGAGDPDKLKKALFPAFVLMSAHEQLAMMMEEHPTELQIDTPLDVLIETATIHHMPPDDTAGNTHWSIKSMKQGRGWLVPIPVGYQGISSEIEAGQLINSRNPEYPAQYVEAIYSLGKWVFPNTIEDIDQAFWYQNYDAEQSLYLIQPNLGDNDV